MATSGILMMLVKRENVLPHVTFPGERSALVLFKKSLAIISAGNSPIPGSFFTARGAPTIPLPQPQ